MKGITNSFAVYLMTGIYPKNRELKTEEKIILQENWEDSLSTMGEEYWSLTLWCRDCKRNNSKIIQTKHKTLIVGCDKCSQSTTIKTQHHTSLKVGPFKITMFRHDPYNYCD